MKPKYSSRQANAAQQAVMQPPKPLARYGRLHQGNGISGA
jgi:hypothetical protein